MTALEAREAVVVAAARGGPDRPHRALRAQRAVLAPLRRADRAADLAAVVHADGRARRARASRPCATAACRSTPRASGARYLDWMENIRPWCISRQLWWGHQIPVWYRGEETYAGMEPPEGEGWERDPDVLDTWFSSQLWPFATLGWPEDTPQLRAFYPTDVLSTARDILFLWVARMVMMGIEFTGEIPFSRRLRAHRSSRLPTAAGCRSRSARASTRSQLIEGGPRPPVFAEGGDFPAYGADAVRFGLLAMSSTPGRALQRGAGSPRAASSPTSSGTPSRLVLLRLPEDARLPASAPGPPPSRTRGSSRACRRPRRDVAEALDAFEFHRAALGALRLRLRRAVRLVPRADQAAALRGRQPDRRRVRAARARRDARARAPADPVRDRGDLVATSRVPTAC